MDRDHVERIECIERIERSERIVRVERRAGRPARSGGPASELAVIDVPWRDSETPAPRGLVLNGVWVPLAP